MPSRNTIARLLRVALVLPIALVVVFGVGHLLQAMGDAPWSQILYRAALIGGIVWIVDLICLLIALAVVAIGVGNSADDEPVQ